MRLFVSTAVRGLARNCGWHCVETRVADVTDVERAMHETRRAILEKLFQRMNEAPAQSINCGPSFGTRAQQDAPFFTNTPCASNGAGSTCDHGKRKRSASFLNGQAESELKSKTFVHVTGPSSLRFRPREN